MPAGVFIFDSRLKILFTNTAFRRSFPALAKRSGTLKDVIACGVLEKCGNGSHCAYCSFKNAMTTAVDTGVEQTATGTIAKKKADRTDTLQVRIRILPVEKNLFLGLTDGSYQTEMAREMLSAKEMQQRLLPIGKSVAGIPYAYTYLPCLQVGGDLTDVYELDGEGYGLIADVSGKGVSAGMLSAFIKTAFDHREKSLADALNALSEKFGQLHLDECLYITLSAVRISPKEGKIRYTSAGHNAPILLKSEFGINEIELPAPPISNWMDYQYEEKEMPYEKGDILVLLTDGVTECKNSVGDMFGVERAESVLLQSHSAKDFIAKLESALSVFSGGNYLDDITAIAFDL